MKAADLATRLGLRAEAVCRYYLSSGRRSGKYWIVGDARNTPGRSMFVRLFGPQIGKGAAGKWADAATGEHGDLLDVIRESTGLADFRDVGREARRFLNLTESEAVPSPDIEIDPIPTGSPEASRRLFNMARPIFGTLAETYLRQRAVTVLHGASALRFHPHCYYRPEDGGSRQTLPAMIAAVTDLHGRQTGAHRTWLSNDGGDKAPIVTPRRAMGDLLGHAVRFGTAGTVMAAGEGIETVLSLRCVLPDMPMAAALSAAHLAAILFPLSLRRLYIIRDNDRAGANVCHHLADRAHRAGIEPIVLSPGLADFNDDLRHFGIQAVRELVGEQVIRRDRIRYLHGAA
ncbi:toprim domain-containing protein [Devosia sp. XJ19-1]|uniref:Toprim domain-containing protein n=1 Tax=Devosia ureilytica TaxID=2952754 RepID=A0A9Q4AM71_9HYPH|nr:toprim domain-containing protein [Devosia ureilytica]MCP8883372.1 toprim domain-containing protein [Devosia ureilytica]MCP8886260.1 toprim domain-containing protein [Devosia ureilytica]